MSKHTHTKEDLPPATLKPPIDQDIKTAVFAIMPPKVTRKDERHAQALAAQWQIARNLWLIQMQLAHNTASLLTLMREWQEPACEGCGRKFDEE